MKQGLPKRCPWVFLIVQYTMLNFTEAFVCETIGSLRLSSLQQHYATVLCLGYLEEVLDEGGAALSATGVPVKRRGGMLLPEAWTSSVQKKWMDGESCLWALVCL